MFESVNYEVSADGKTMTVTSAIGEQVIVFDRR